MAYQDIFRSHDLVRRGSIEELCGHRDRALELYGRAFDLLAEAEKAYKLAVGSPKGSVYLEFLRDVRFGRPEAESVRTEIDSALWRHILVASNLMSLMDEEERKKFQQQLERGEAPAATVPNIDATVTRLYAEARTIFRRGLVNAFSRLSDIHKTNDGFKLGPRAIMRGIVTWNPYLGFSLSTYRDGELADIDRVFHVLDGRPSPGYSEGISGLIREGMRNVRGEDEKTTAESDYIAAKWHKSGTLHLRFLRDDLRQAANRLIAEHYGAALSGRHASANHQGSTP